MSGHHAFDKLVEKLTPERKARAESKLRTLKEQMPFEDRANVANFSDIENSMDAQRNSPDSHSRKKP